MNTDKENGAAPKSKSNRRKLRNIVVNRDFQFRFAACFVVNTVLGLAMFPFVIGEFFEYENITETVANGQTIISVVPDANVLYLKALIFLLVYNVVTILLAVVLSHRLAGPVVAIKNHIEKLIAGEFSSRIKLRKNDELKDVEAVLNRLAEKLERGT